MEWLKQTGYHAVSAQQVFDGLELGAPLPAKPVMITFDDGYRDVLVKALPTLIRLHMPATAFVITDRISGPDPSFLTWSELRRLEQSGVAIGSHTVTHANLTSLSDAQALGELRDSRTASSGTSAIRCSGSPIRSEPRMRGSFNSSARRAMSSPSPRIRARPKMPAIRSSSIAWRYAIRPASPGSKRSFAAKHLTQYGKDEAGTGSHSRTGLPVASKAYPPTPC